MLKKEIIFKEKFFPHIPTTLIIVFLVSIIGLLLISIFHLFNDEGILVNIATELIGILVTILIVEYFIKKYEIKKWSKFKKLFQTNLKLYLTTIFLEFKYLYKLKVEFSQDYRNLVQLLQHKSQILELIKQAGMHTASAPFNTSTENLDNLISLAKINPDPDLITILLNIKSSLSLLNTVRDQKDNPLWDDYRKVIEDSIEHSFTQALDDLAYLEKNYLLS